MSSPVEPYGAGFQLVSREMNGWPVPIRARPSVSRTGGSAPWVGVASSALVFQMLERPAELMPGAMDVCLDGPEGEVEGGRDLLVRPTLDMPEHDAGSVLGSETGDRALDGRAHLASLELVQRGLLVHDYVKRRRLDGIGRLSVGRAVHADGVELPAPQVIDRDVVGDLEQPARKLEFGAVAVDVVQDLDESVLRQILGELAIAHHAIDERENRSLIPANQLAERSLAALLGQCDDISVRKIEEV